MLFKKLFIITLTGFVLLFSSLKAETECFEKTSRAIFGFNQGFDRIILEPVAKQYNKLPEPIKNGTGNFTSNIATLLSIPNYVLQGNFSQAFDASGSFVINTTIGIIGLGNPAKKMGFEAQKEDVGQTLGTYGVKSGCYFVLPILGPTTLRDSVGMVADSFVDPFSIATWREKEFLGVSGCKIDYVGVKAATAVDFRGDNVTNFDSLEKNSIDFYASLRSLYLQDKENKIKNNQRGSVKVIYKDEEDWEEIDSK